MSEICERIGTANFFLQNCEHYYALNLNNIENKDIQEKIENIEKILQVHVKAVGDTAHSHFLPLPYILCF